MDLKEKLDQVVEIIKTLKESKVRESPDSPDLMMYLHFYRGDFVPTVAQCRLDTDVVLEAAWIGAKGFSATELVLSSEAYHAVAEKSPLTGEPWQHHREMQYVAETMPEAGAVLECLTSLIVDRTGQVITNMSCYRITDGVLEWLEEILLDEQESVKTSRPMVDQLRKTMEQPMLKDTLRDADVLSELMSLNLGQELFEYHCDMATSRVLSSRDLVTHMMMGADPGSKRYQLIQEQLGEPDA